MKRILLSVTLMAMVAAPTLAQTWHPVAPITSSASPSANGVTISLQGQYFNWKIPSIITGTTSESVSEDQLSGLVAVDATVAQRGVIGGWFASDKQKASLAGASFGKLNTTITTGWYEVHGAYYFYDKPTVSAGLLVGYLGDHTNIAGATPTIGNAYATSVTNPKWTEIALVGSLPLSRASKTKGAQIIGLTVGRALHQDSKETDGTSYGISYTYPLNLQWSIDLSTWELAVDHASTVTRAGGGIGYHF